MIYCPLVRTILHKLVNNHNAVIFLKRMTYYQHKIHCNVFVYLVLSYYIYVCIYKRNNWVIYYLISGPPLIVALCQVAVWHRNTSTVKNCLSELKVHGLGRHRRCSQRVPDLLTALERRSGVPKLISFTSQLALRQRHIRFPPYRLVTKGLILPQTA